MQDSKIEMVDKIQILTRAISIAQVSRENISTGMVVRTIPSVDDVVANYKKLYAALTEEPSE